MFSEPSGEVIILEKWGMVASPLNQPDLESLWGKQMWELCKSQRHIEIVLKKHSLRVAFDFLEDANSNQLDVQHPLINSYIIIYFIYKISHNLFLLWNTKKSYDLSSGTMKSAGKTCVIHKKKGGRFGSFKQVTNVPSLSVMFFPGHDMSNNQKKSKTHARISMIVSSESKG